MLLFFDISCILFGLNVPFNEVQTYQSSQSPRRISVPFLNEYHHFNKSDVAEGAEWVTLDHWKPFLSHDFNFLIETHKISINFSFISTHELQRRNRSAEHHTA
jgi:hypothetical protein